MRILILGGTGMLGHKLWQQLGTRFQDCHVTVRYRRSDYSRFGFFDDARVIENVDVARFGILSATLDAFAPRVIINCTGITKRRERPHDPASSILINALLPHRIAAWCAAHDARLINFSTDCVFDGRRGNYSELDPTNAEDLYGRTKALGECSDAHALTLRSSFIGRELTDGTELLEWLIAQNHRTVKGYRRAMYSGLSTLRLATVVGDIIEKFPYLSGLYQVASAPISKYDLLVLAQKAFALDVKVEPDDAVVINRVLDAGKLRNAAGYEAPAWPEMMAELAADPTPYGNWRP